MQRIPLKDDLLRYRNIDNDPNIKWASIGTAHVAGVQINTGDDLLIDGHRVTIDAIHHYRVYEKTHVVVMLANGTMMGEEEAAGKLAPPINRATASALAHAVKWLRFDPSRLGCNATAALTP